MISTKVSECMTKDFAIIKPEMMVAEASANLIKKDLLGGPVVDDAGQLIGWISEQECLQVTLQVAYHNTKIATVSDVMRTDVMTVGLSQDILMLADQMLAAKPKSYPVVDGNNKVLGVITRRHILNLLDENLKEMNS